MMLAPFIFFLSVIGSKVKAGSIVGGNVHRDHWEPDTYRQNTRSRDDGINTLTEHQYLGNESFKYSNNSSLPAFGILTFM